jgi:hypothetical protein
MQVGMALTPNSLARRKPGVQIPSPPPHNGPGHRPCGSPPPGWRRSRSPYPAAHGQQLRSNNDQRDLSVELGAHETDRPAWGYAAPGQLQAATLRHSLRAGGAYPWLRWPSASVLIRPLGGVERPGRVVRFARLIHRPVSVLGGPAVRAAYSGNHSLPYCRSRWQ